MLSENKKIKILLAMLFWLRSVFYLPLHENRATSDAIVLCIVLLLLIGLLVYVRATVSLRRF